MKRRKLFAAAAVLATPKTADAAGRNLDLAAEIEKANANGSGVVRLAAGHFETTGIKLDQAIRIEGIPGQTFLFSKNGQPIFLIVNTAKVSLFGLGFDGNNAKMTEHLPALVVGWKTETLEIDQCSFANSANMGVRMEGCTGHVSRSQFSHIADIGIYSVNNTAMRIADNNLSDIGNNGIQLIQNDETLDGGTLVTGNIISKVRADSGGSGQNGNGIGIFSSNNVIVSGNRVSDTAYSSIRCNSGKNVQIIGNSCQRSAETAIYVEFAFLGAVVANNIIEDAAFGISITNFDVAGRMSVCTGNIIRRMHVGHTEGVTNGGGIHCEADTLIANNIVEDVAATAINLGWADKCRNVMAQGNIIRKCARGIGFSMTEGAQHVLIAGNMIEGASEASIVGLLGDSIKTGDFMKGNEKMPAHVNMYGNVVTG
jgi:uncharacterized secreted repeat protein (TIGR03808 family)